MMGDDDCSCTSCIRAAVPEYVYFAQDDRTGDIKIGLSWQPANRVAAIARQVRSTMTLLCVVRGRRADERAWHLRFAHLRLDGEWFRSAPELLNAIEQPVASGPEGGSHA